MFGVRDNCRVTGVASITTDAGVFSYRALQSTVSQSVGADGALRVSCGFGVCKCGSGDRYIYLVAAVGCGTSNRFGAGDSAVVAGKDLNGPVLCEVGIVIFESFSCGEVGVVNR